jgi:hypothetical protein
MATITKEVFDDSVARIKAEPADITVKVKQIELDLTLPGILARVQFLANEAHQKGDLLEAHFKEIIDSADKPKNAVSRLDPRQLLKGLPGFKGKG